MLLPTHASYVAGCLAATTTGLSLLIVPGGTAAPSVRLESPIVFTQVPRRMGTSPAAGNPQALLPADWFDGARLVVLSTDGRLRVLSSGLDSACDPNVSFDGHRVLFAGKQERTSRWRIWEIGLEGEGLRAVSPQDLEARSPIHATTLFTLESPEPWLTAVFVVPESTLNETGRASASSLYSIKLDGTELRRLTFNPNHNIDPFQMWDGRLLYSAERYPNQPGAAAGRVGLYAIHVEGADMEFYGGERGARIQRMSCATERGLVVFVESDRTAWDGAGQLAGIEERRPHLTYRQLTKPGSQSYLYPSPLQGNRLLVSRRPSSSRGTSGVFCFDADLGRCELVFDSPDYHEVQAVLAAPRKRPDGHSTVVDPKVNTGLFYGLNCYDSDARMAPHIQTGMVKRVRLIEGVPQPADRELQSVSLCGSSVARRLVGEAPVEADGSFNVEVPADVPLLLQTLDERGLALATCGWIWVKPKEKRGCIGCHEDPERIPENDYVLALRRPSNQLVLPPEDRRTISFREDVAPILAEHCATTDCHGGARTRLALPLRRGDQDETALRRSYSSLLAPAATRRARTRGAIGTGKYIDVGRARTSWLVWQLTGQDTSRPWDREIRPAMARQRKITAMPPTNHGRPLSPEALRTIIQWIDLGAPYAPPVRSQNPDHPSLP